VLLKYSSRNDDFIQENGHKVTLINELINNFNLSDKI